MVKNKDIIMRYRKEIDKYNATLGDYEQVKKFELIADEWSVNNGILTPTLKVKRNVVKEVYKNLIEEMYKD